MFNRCACKISRTLFCSLVSHHPRQARQIKAKEAEIIGLWNGLKVSFNSVFVLIKMRENNGMKSSLFMVASRNSPEKTLQRHRNVGRSALHYESEKIEIIITLKLKYNTES